MPPKLDVVGNPITMLQLELLWKTKPVPGEVIALNVETNTFSLIHAEEGEHVAIDPNTGRVSYTIVARHDGHYWYGQLYWAGFSKRFSTSPETICIFSRLLRNNQYENLIIDHARDLAKHVDKPHWYYVGQMGGTTHWSVDIDGHPTLFHSSPKEEGVAPTPLEGPHYCPDCGELLAANVGEDEVYVICLKCGYDDKY